MMLKVKVYTLMIHKAEQIQEVFFVLGDFDSNDIVEETIRALFVNVYIEHTTKKGQPLNLEFGLRYEEVDQESTGTTSFTNSNNMVFV